ncbi:redoxin domain-containing protein [bacterium]|nr:redoxin domain-containing protein [bacterium]
MKKLIIFAWIVGGVALFALSATVPKNILDLLAKVDKNNASLKTIRASLLIVQKRGKESQSIKGELWLDNQTGKFKANIGENDSLTTIVYDGDQLWNYYPSEKVYIKRKISPEEIETRIFELLPPLLSFRPNLTKTFTSEYFTNSLEKATLQKSTLDKKSVSLITFYEKDGSSQFKICIDPKVNRIVQFSFVVPKQEEEIIFKITDFQADVPLPGDFFKFTPPADAKEFSPQAGGNFEGKPAPDFTLMSLDGKTYTLSNLKGKVVLLDFWATWCPPCREELPIIEKLHQEYKDKGLLVLGINDEDKATVENFLKENNLTFPILVDAQSKVALLYNVESIPRVLLIDKDGNVVKDLLGYSKENEQILREAIEKLLGK